MKRSPRSQGVALILTLMMLVLISIIVIGIAHSVRLERTAASTNLEKALAEEFSGLAIDKVRATLQKQTADPNRNWISQPGGVVIPAPAATNQQVSQFVDLSSGEAAASGSAIHAPAMLNQRLFREPSSQLIADNLDPLSPDSMMPVKWIYIRRDGTEDASATPDASDKSNPLVGRYAFWTDDESSKVNLNLAWTRAAANTSAAGNQSRVSLTAMPGFTEPMAAVVHGFVTGDNYQTVNERFFNSPEDARRLEIEAAGISEVLKENHFSLTHYNHDPDTTFFNEPRIVLTTRKDKAGGRVFLDIAKVDNTDLAKGDSTVIDETKLNNVINLLVRYLKRTDWPMTPGSSFQGKYYQGTENRLTQLALNIIDYVRSKESAEKMVVPLRGEKPPNSKFSLGVVSTPDSFIGIARGPRITEMGVWLPASPDTNGVYKGRLVFEIYLPENFGIDEIDLTKLRMNFSGIPDAGTKFDHGSYEPFITAGMVSNVDPLHFKKGEYAVVKAPIEVAGITSRAAVTSVALRLALVYNAGRLDLAPLLGTSASYPSTIVDPSSVAVNDISSIEVDDPRVNSHKDDWRPSIGAGTKKNTFGARNSVSTIGNDPIAGLSPQQDTDASGKISAASLYMAPPKGAAGNPDGLVTSPAELGYIHTGMESSAKAGVPWRTMRLQPNNAPDTSAVPDWAFMDLFVAPADAAVAGQEVFSPHGSSTGGRVNLNAAIEPFSIERTLPLAAVFLAAQKSSLSSTTKVNAQEAKDIATNIQNRVLAVNGKQYGYPKGYDSPGEVVEIKGVADSGEESEELVRQTGNLLTTRGNVFSIFSIGQSLKQTGNGSFVVTAEQRQQAMIERYVVTIDDKGTLDPSDDVREVRFQTVFFRNISP